MSRTLFEHLSPDTGAKRMLALDGGGVKGVLTLGLLKPLEDELRRRAGGDADFRLSDYYDLIGGTSTGAIIASGLALGLSVDELTELNMRVGPDVFGRTAGDGILMQSRFDAKKLRRALVGFLGAKTLGTEDLKTGLAIYAKRLDDDGAAWVVTNHPLGTFYDPPEDSGVYPNKRYRLADVVLASAAPSYIDDVMIDIAFDERRRPIRKGYFVDGAISASSNPSVQMLMLALDPAYRFGWNAGPENLMMTSCGAGNRRPRMAGPAFQTLPLNMRTMHVLRSLIYDSEMLGVTLLQAFSETRKIWPVSAEGGDQGSSPLGAALLDYQRIDVMLERKPKPKRKSDPTPPMTQLERLIGRELSADAMEELDHPANGHPRNLALLLEIGVAGGKTLVGEAYPDPRFDLASWRR